ncbi:hypothetical protein ACFFLG_19105 [Shewanella indica]|uniref:hypothetical protein n=1 Tax=Shewanella TaxID=22 RepID=UPI000C348FC8|nr:hypothetical protein [Shewanella indica]GHB02554.1 hypothetical protein GCM10007107_14380 [Shewanella indica]
MNELLCRKLRLTHKNGQVLYPVRIKNNDTGKLAFRLSKKGNTKAEGIEVSDEQDMILKVTTQGYKVRARTEQPPSQGGIAGLYALDQRSISHWQKIETKEKIA